MISAYTKRDGNFSPFIIEVLPLLGLTLWILYWYHSILQNFWLFDDPALLKFTISFNPLEYLFSPAIYAKLSRANFTPWLGISFDLDWMLFGLRPSGFYLHHLISLCTLILIGYGLLRLWFPRSLSFVSMLLFALTPPFVESAHMLMVRHYIEGLIFALLSCYFFVSGVRRDSRVRSIVGAFFYLLACLAKEVYVPLPFVLVILPEAQWRQRLRHLIPWSIVLFMYIALRRYMLGRYMGGYGWSFTLDDAILFIPRVVDAMCGGFHSTRWSLAGVSWCQFLIGASTFLVLILLLAKDRKALLSAGFVLPFVILPIVPVSSQMSSRYVWILTFCWIVLHALSWRTLLKTGKLALIGGMALWSLLMLTGFVVMNAENSLLEESIVRQDAEGQFILIAGTERDILVNPAGSEWYYSGLLWLRKEVLHSTAAPVMGYDAFILCEDFLLSGGKGTGVDENYLVWRFDRDKRALNSQNIAGFCTEEVMREPARKDAPLFLKIHYEKDIVSWEAGPYTSGQYVILFSPPKITYIHDIGTRGSWFFPKDKGTVIPIRLRYISPEGWRTYSPLLYFRKKGPVVDLVWQR